MAGDSASKVYAAFAGTVLIGGMNFIAVSFSNKEMPPLFGATLRFALAALLFLLIARVMRVPLARGRSAVGALIYGVLAFGAAYAFLYYALVGLTAGAVAVIVASTPLFTLIIAMLARQERLSVSGLIGGVLAIAGIGVLSLGSLAGDIRPFYLVVAILGTVGVAASGVVAKAFTEVHPVNMNAIGMVAGTMLLAAASLLLGERWAFPKEPQTLIAVTWLVVFGSVGLFLLFLYVIKRWTASAAEYALAGMPLVAVGLGALLLDQPVTVAVMVGGAMVAAAVYIGAIHGRRKSA